VEQKKSHDVENTNVLLSPDAGHDFPLLVTSQMMTPMIKRTIRTPTQTPALNMPPITAQLFKSNISMTVRKGKNFFICFHVRREKSCHRILC
jgi:hypothetical protein